MKKCKICGEINKTNLCERCNYLLKNGASEEIIKNMLSDKKTNKIWSENKKIANELAYAYYDYLLKEYKKIKTNKDSKENFGFNMFAEGINLGLDVIMPLLDEEKHKEVLEKIRGMVRRRNDKNI